MSNVYQAGSMVEVRLVGLEIGSLAGHYVGWLVGWIGCWLFDVVCWFGSKKVDRSYTIQGPSEKINQASLKPCKRMDESHIQRPLELSQNDLLNQ